jgi:RNA-binding protein Musashi
LTNKDIRYEDDQEPTKPTQPAPVALPEPPVANGSAEVTVHDDGGEAEQHGNEDQDGYRNEHDQDGDDEVDFNLGNGNGGGYRNPPSPQRSHGPGRNEDG